MEKRATYQSLYGGIFGIASVVGPLVGGAFTDKVTWRWCFWINLPLGAVSAAFIIFSLRLPSKPNPLKEMGVLGLLWNLDPVGFVLFVPSIICLLFALQVCLIIPPPSAHIRVVVLTLLSGEARHMRGTADR